MRDAHANIAAYTHIAFEVEDVEKIFSDALKRGATKLGEVTEKNIDGPGPLVIATNASPGEFRLQTHHDIIIKGGEINGLEALFLMIDSANGVSAELNILNWTFVPVDMTVGLYRQPIGPWVGMAARTSIGNEGIGQTTATTFDSKGSNGNSIHTLFVRPR